MIKNRIFGIKHVFIPFSAYNIEIPTSFRDIPIQGFAESTNFGDRKHKYNNKTIRL